MIMLKLSCMCLSLAIVGLYLTAYIVSVGRIPKSIGATRKRTTSRWLFPLMVVLSTGLIIPSLFDVNDSMLKFLAYFIVGGTCAVSVSPFLEHSLADVIKGLGAFIAGAAILCYTILAIGVPWFVLVFALMTIIAPRYRIFLLECGFLTQLYYIMIRFSFC